MFGVDGQHEGHVYARRVMRQRVRLDANPRGITEADLEPVLSPRPVPRRPSRGREGVGEQPIPVAVLVLGAKEDRRDPLVRVGAGDDPPSTCLDRVVKQVEDCLAPG
jgi:hypothetical protein